MADLAYRRIADAWGLPTPLVSRGALTIAVHEPACQALLSRVSDDGAFDDAARGVLGFDLPREPNRTAGERTLALWLAPDQWLVVADDPATPDLAARLDAALTPCGGFVSDVTHGQIVFDLSGSGARDLLAMGCALDIGGGAVVPERCARTNFAGVHTLMWAHGDGYRLQVDRVFARHLAEWLIEAATTFA